MKVQGKEITDENKQVQQKEITDPDETIDEMETEGKLKEDKTVVKKKRKRSNKSRWTVAKKKKVGVTEVENKPETKEAQEMEEISAVKMGCNKCIEVFYSERGYHEHLTSKHRIKNYSKYPPTIISRLWTKLPAVPKLSEADLKAREFQCGGCPSRFFGLSALETHEKICYKALPQVKENQAQFIYEMIEKANKEEREKDAENVDTGSRKSRSRTVKKDEEETKGKRKRDSTSKADESRKQSKVSSKKEKEAEEEISDNESNVTKEETDPKAATTDELKRETGKRTLKLSIERIPTKSHKTESNTKEDGRKEFTKKPLPKKYPLRSNKEVEAAEKLLAKYKTIEKKDAKEEEEPSNITSNFNSISDNVDNNDLDGNYSPEETQNSSTTSGPETPKLPTISRPRTRSMKPSESVSTMAEDNCDSKPSTRKRKAMDENAENKSSQKPNKKSKDSKKKLEKTEGNDDEIPESNNEEVDNLSKIGDEKSERMTEKTSQKKQTVGKKGKKVEDPISNKKDVDENKDEMPEMNKSGKPKKKKNSNKKETINEDEEHSEDGNNDIPDEPEETQKSAKTKNQKPTAKPEETKGAEDEDDDFYKCNVCEKVFATNEKYKEHKKKCTKVPKKHVCSKSSKGLHI